MEISLRTLLLCFLRQRLFVAVKIVNSILSSLMLSAGFVKTRERLIVHIGGVDQKGRWKGVGEVKCLQTRVVEFILEFELYGT